MTPSSNIHRICAGWDDPASAPDEATNGALDLTAIVDTGQLNPGGLGDGHRLPRALSAGQQQRRRHRRDADGRERDARRDADHLPAWRRCPRPPRTRVTWSSFTGSITIGDQTKSASFDFEVVRHVGQVQGAGRRRRRDRHGRNDLGIQGANAGFSCDLDRRSPASRAADGAASLRGARRRRTPASSSAASNPGQPAPMRRRRRRPRSRSPCRPAAACTPACRRRRRRCSGRRRTPRPDRSTPSPQAAFTHSAPAGAGHGVAVARAVVARLARVHDLIAAAAATQVDRQAPGRCRCCWRRCRTPRRIGDPIAAAGLHTGRPAAPGRVAVAGAVVARLPGSVTPSPQRAITHVVRQAPGVVSLLLAPLSQVSVGIEPSVAAERRPADVVQQRHLQADVVADVVA